MGVTLGAVAYDPKVVTIWDGFRAWLRGPGGVDFDYVLYSNYERQVLDLVDGRVDVAWNSPLAWVRARRVDAACMIDSNLLLFGREGVLPAGAVRVLAQTPPYDHCTMTAGPSAAGNDGVGRLGELLRGMDYADAALRPLLDLEGLKEWRPPRLSGYDQLERAVDEAGFYDAAGAVTAAGYRP